MNGFDTVREFAERIGVSTKTVYRMIEDRIRRERRRLGL